MCKESSLMPDEISKKSVEEDENKYWHNQDENQQEENADTVKESSSRDISARADVLKQSLAEDKRRQMLKSTSEATGPSVKAESSQNSIWLDFCVPPPALCGVMQTLDPKPDCGCGCATCPRVTMQSFIVQRAIGSKVTSFAKLCLEYSGKTEEFSEDSKSHIQSKIDEFMKGDEIRQLKENNWDLQPGLERLFDLLLKGEKYILFDAGIVDKYSRGVFGALLTAIKQDESSLLDEVTFESYYDARLHYDATYHCIKRYIKNHEDQITYEQLFSYIWQLFCCQNLNAKSQFLNVDEPFLAYISCAIKMIVHQCTDYQWERVKDTLLREKLLIRTTEKKLSKEIEYLNGALKALRNLGKTEMSAASIQNFLREVDTDSILSKNSHQRLVLDLIVEALKSNQEEIKIQKILEVEKDLENKLDDEDDEVEIQIDSAQGLSLQGALKFQSELKNDLAFIGSKKNVPKKQKTNVPKEQTSSVGTLDDWIEDNSAFPGFFNPCTEQISKDFGYSELIDWKMKNSRSSPDDFLKKFNEETADISKCLRASIWVLLPSACLFYALILFDILGDEVGITGALWSPLTMLCVFPFVLISCRLSRLDFLFKKKRIVKLSELLPEDTYNVGIEPQDESGNSAVVKTVHRPHFHPRILKNIDITEGNAELTPQFYLIDDEGNTGISSDDFIEIIDEKIYSKYLADLEKLADASHRECAKSAKTLYRPLVDGLSENKMSTDIESEIIKKVSAKFDELW